MLLGVTWVVALFLSAGTPRWLAGWLFVAVTVAGLGLHRAHVARHNPELLHRRQRLGEGTKAWDKFWLAVFWPLMMSVAVVGGIDVVRRHGEPLPAWAFLAGAALYGLGMAVSAWAMGVNPHFEGAVRIQPDQRPISAGPYRCLRHPGYAGLVLWALAMPLLLRSRWAWVPALAAAGWVAVRTALEDALLLRELPGYREYASRVRHRLLPGLW